MSADHDTADPLDGADIGETETVTNTETIWIGQLASDDASGSDRLADHEVVATEVVTDDLGEECLAVTVKSDVTKRLPHRWDTAREPRTDAEERAERWATWKRRAAAAFPMVISLGIGLAVTNHVMRAAAGDVTINGEPFVAPTVAELALPVGLIVILAYLVHWAVSGGIQPHYGGRP